MLCDFNNSYPNTEEKSDAFLVELQNLTIMSFTNKLFEEKTQNKNDDNTVKLTFHPSDLGLSNSFATRI